MSKDLIELNPNPSQLNIEYNRKNNTLITLKNLINSPNHIVEKTSMCGLMLLSTWSSSKIPKILMTGICLRKLYKFYQNNKEDIENILDNAF